MLIERLQVRGLLSFGPDGVDLPLEPLNVIIGPNGSGKSNLLKVLALLRAAPRNLSTVFKTSGDMAGWFWQPSEYIRKATINATVASGLKSVSIKHSLGLSCDEDRLSVHHERIDRTTDSSSSLVVQTNGSGQIFLGSSQTPLYGFHMPPGRSMLSLYTDLFDLDHTPFANYIEDELAFQRLIICYHQMHLHADWTFGDDSPVRETQSTGSWGHWLFKHGENLANVISNFSPSDRDKLSYYMTRFYDGIAGVSTPVNAGRVALMVEESGGRLIPAARLSDGTLRYLSLLTALLDPELPSLIAIEEPELGLHPDVIYDLAELLVEASTRTQVIVTTHSPTLIDALSDHPSSVIACEKYEGQTHFTRVNPDELASWQGDRGLGEVWTMGSIGGTRW